MGFADALALRRAPGPADAADRADRPRVAVIEDRPELAELAAELCERLGLVPTTYPTPARFLAELGERPPRLIVLDWRLEREVGAAVFLAVRHRFEEVPIVCWTAAAPEELPDMLAGDARTRLVRKASGLAAFEDAVRWARELG